MSAAPVYLLPGMAGGDRIFDRLGPLLPNARAINWIDPRSDESLAKYAVRIAAEVTEADCFIAGVSFGGVVALEVSRIVQPRGCFLISSNPNQLPPWLRIWRIFAGSDCQRTLNGIGRVASIIPRKSRTRSTGRITKLAGAAGGWQRWATSAVLGWRPDCRVADVSIIQIHGDADATFPIRYVTPDIIIPTGGHVLPLTHPNAVADAMLSVMQGSPRRSLH